MLKFSSLDCFVNKLSVLVNVHRYQVQQTEIVCYDYCDASYVVKLVELSFFFFFVLYRNLHGCSLEGTLASELGNLTHLRSL